MKLFAACLTAVLATGTVLQAQDAQASRLPFCPEMENNSMPCVANGRAWSGATEWCEFTGWTGFTCDGRKGRGIQTQEVKVPQSLGVDTAKYDMIGSGDHFESGNAIFEEMANGMTRVEEVSRFGSRLHYFSCEEQRPGAKAGTCNIYYDQDGRILEHSVNYYAADDHVKVIDIHPEGELFYIYKGAVAPWLF